MKWLKNLFSSDKNNSNEKPQEQNNIHTIEDKYTSSEPWIDVVRINMEDKNNPSTGYFELDWNKAFVNQLTEAGYSGRTEEEIVEQWFNDLCRGVISDNLPQ
jgi:hypothetical protein